MLVLVPVPSCVSDRKLYWFKHYSVLNDNLDLTSVSCGSGKTKLNKHHVSCDFGITGDGEAISQQVYFSISEPRLVSGLGLRVKLRGWKNISYIAVGYTEDGVYQHAKANHPRQNHWFDFCIGFQDLAWGWRNNWIHPEDRVIEDIRFYIKGVPDSDAGCDISDFWVWQEDTLSEKVFGEEHKISEEIINNLFSYQQAYFPNYAQLARAFMEKGLCPLAGNTSLEWPVKETVPKNLNTNGTWQYSWHSQHPAIMLLLLANDKNELGPLFAARELVANWLTQSFDTPDPNIKYTWYDHGVAERVLAMIMLYASGQEYGFDVRFMTRLRNAIYLHSQLLASEIFYVSHQTTRYHNHGWFQDLALLGVASSFPQWRGSPLWADTALSRIQDQFEKLIIFDNDFAVFVENSLGYHLGIERLVASVGCFASLSGRNTNIPQLAEALSDFSRLMLYPSEERGVAQGDTFRRANPRTRSEVIKSVQWDAQSVFLKEAGYAIIKGGSSDLPWMLTLFATNKNSTHKHEDDLSLFFWMDGIEWLIDPSFYSHEYAEELPAYLRSAKAHSMLYVKDVTYDYQPWPDRSQLKMIKGQDKAEMSIRGLSRACKDFEIVRELDYRLQNGRPRIQGLDYFVGSAGCEEQNAAEGELTFHIGDGVEILQKQSAEEGWKYELLHPASKRVLVLTIHPAAGIKKIEIEPSESGLGFLEKIATQAIRITLPHSVECQWSLQVK